MLVINNASYQLRYSIVFLQVDDVVGETSPEGLWEKKPVDLTRWYFESLKPQPSFLSLISEDKEEKEGHKKGEIVSVGLQ